MFVKVYRYRIKQEKIEEFLDIQRRACQIYQKHVTYRAVHLQRHDDPSHWLEIHWYPDQATYHHSMDLINAEPEIERLWQEFQTVLDPKDTAIYEECYEQVRSEGNLSSA